MKDRMYGNAQASKWILPSIGLWLVISASYALTSSGRLDTIDSQFKFDVTASIIEVGDVKTRDPVLVPRAPIAAYPLGATLAGLPLSALGLNVSPSSFELAQFLWCLTTGFITALIAPTLLWSWRRQGFALSNASLWAGVAAFATLIWPVAASSFDQTQHAWFLLVAVLLADAAAEKRSSWLGLLTGFVLSLVLHYQPAYAILFVPIAVAVVPWHGEDTIRDKLRLPVLIGIGALPGLLALIYFNYYRSAGSYALVSLNSGDQGLWGNPVIGALVLLVSPGKGILLFTPIMLVAALGVREMWEKHRRLTSLIGGVTITHFALVSSLAFPGGDWCWGPRYLAVTLPLVCLILPYGARRLAPVLVVSLVIVSLAVQILGLTRDHQRFYLDHNVKPYFWTEDTTFHLRTSQLSYRISELLDPNSPGHFETFSSAPYPLLTYAPFGPPAALVSRSKEWARQFAVFYWPRPWPLWMIRLPEPLRFLNVQAIVTVFVVMLVTGLVLIAIGLQLDKAARSLPGRDPQASG